jgi:hypothetical protein
MNHSSQVSKLSTIAGKEALWKGKEGGGMQLGPINPGAGMEDLGNLTDLWRDRGGGGS